MKDWEQFEIAVASFISALDPRAHVERNVRIPDADTGNLRQYDVWVETTLGGHLPLKILISCKRLSRELDQQHIDAFIGELAASGAHKGVIYSYSGYSKPALEKCEKRGISACRLYQNQPPDLPEAIQLHAYCCRSKMTVNLLYNSDLPSKYITWNDLFDEETSAKAGPQLFVDFLILKIHELEQVAVQEKDSSEAFPPKKSERFWIRDEEGFELGIEIVVDWEVFEAEVGAYLIDGSYSITDKDFKGVQSLPSINGSGADPGPGWKLLKDLPYKLRTPGVTVIQHKHNVSAPVKEYLGPMPLRQQGQN